MSSYTACYRCGESGHYERQCTAVPPPSAADPLQGTPFALKRRPEDICDEERMHAIVHDIRDHMTHGMPLWLYRRMTACKQVAESRATR